MTVAVLTIREQIDAQARQRGDAAFVIEPESGRALTFAQLKHGADALGVRFDRRGIARQDKVAFLLDNGAWAVQLLLGIMAAGRVAVPLNAVAGRTQLQYVLDHSDAELVFVAPRYTDKLNELLAGIERGIEVVETPPDAGPRWDDSVVANDDDVTAVADAGDDATDAGADAAPAAPPPTQPTESDTALLLYTSGSTGLPKGALLSHRAIVSGGRNVVAGHALTAADRALCVLPVYHINGAMVTVCAPLCSGGSVVMPTRFSAAAFWQLVAAHRCTWSSVVPTIINYLLDRVAQGEEKMAFGGDPRLQQFRFGRSASAPLPAAVLREWERVFGVPMIETLGLTETAGTVASNPLPPGVRKVDSVGIACGNAIAILDSDGRQLAAGARGEIAIRGRNLLDEYYKNESATRAAFAGDWFRSGDLGHLDADGYLFITGRLKELIIRGGENIAPREIDDALYRHPAVLEAAAVGVAHPDYGQEVAACVALRDGFNCTARALMDFCAQSVGEVKAPKAVYFLDELPKGPSGKILRLKLPEIIDSLNES
ncbi:MAG: AMP-binding protein [Gammaproteobacteria bacterium]|nr:AMP-binding protein [Gammaproteobacteria bacterium]